MVRRQTTTAIKFTPACRHCAYIPPHGTRGRAIIPTLPPFTNRKCKIFTHTTTHRVRYGETDQMGYLYHGRYAELYETGRTEALRSLGLTYAGMEAAGTMMPVMSLNQRFVRPARYDDLLTIRTTLRRPPARTITFHVEVLNAAGKLVNGGSAKLCFVNAEDRRSVSCPDYLLAKLRPYFEDPTT